MEPLDIAPPRLARRTPVSGSAGLGEPDEQPDHPDDRPSTTPSRASSPEVPLVIWQRRVRQYQARIQRASTNGFRSSVGHGVPKQLE